MVDGAVFEAGDVVGEELEGHGAGHDGSVERTGRNGDVIIDGGDGFAVSFGHDAQDAGVAGLALGDVAKGFVFAGAIVAEGDDGNVFLQKRDGAMLEFSGVIAFGVDIRDLFEFKSSFEGDGIHITAANEESTGLIKVAFSNFGDGVVLFENAFDEVGNGFDFPYELAPGVA